MKTTKLYQTDRYLKNWKAVITSIVPANPPKDDDASGNCLITLDRTAFFPEGGGQSCDIGFINDVPVTDVQEKDDEIYHTISSLKCNDLSPGDHVICSIDWERRFDNMQRHCGEHILSGAFYSLFGGVNRGFHMGHDHMTIDISLEGDPNVTELTYKDAIKAQNKANEVIWSDAPVTIDYFDTREEAEKLPLRKALAFDEDISIVSIGSPENISDCVACCGTHPSSAGQVGLIKVYKVEKYKGMFRISFEAGKRALKDYDIKHDILTDLSTKYSSSAEDLPLKLEKQEQKLTASKDQLYKLKNAMIKDECRKLDQLLIDAEEPVVICRLAVLSIDDAFNMGKRYMGNASKLRGRDGLKLLMIYSAPDTSYILVSSGDTDCGAVVKKNAPACNGRGGGNDVSARAIFPDEDDALRFADLVKEDIR